MSLPLITVTIPTLNSAHTLNLCLSALFSQKYRNLEVIIVDSYSTDETKDVVKKYKSVRFIQYMGGLLGSRITGINQAKGKYVLLLDSDQILEPGCFEKALEICQKEKADMAALEEGVYECKNFIQWLFVCDRKLIEKTKDFNPQTSAILPRFFRTAVLRKAIKNIPKKIINTVGGPDHAILYFETWQITQKIAYIPQAVLHMETSLIIQLIKKCYRWGYTSASAKTILKYRQLMQTKEWFRKGLFKNGLIIESIASILLLFIKGIPYKIGYLQAKLRT